MKLSSIYILLIVSIFLGACNVQKRIYRKGYHVVWDHKKQHSIKKSEDVKVVQENTTLQEIPSTAMASSEKDIIDVKQEPSLLLKDTCGDKLLLQNAEELIVKVIEISETTIKYKRCDNLNGPLFTISKTKVALITYANGVRETIIAQPEPKIDVQTMKDPSSPMNRVVNRKGAFSFFSLPLVVVLLIVLLFAAILSFPTSTLIAILTAIGVCVVLGIVLGYLALFDFKKKPKMYKHKWMPIVSLSIYLAYSAMFALAILLNASMASMASMATIAIGAVIFLALLGLFIYALLPGKSGSAKTKTS